MARGTSRHLSGSRSNLEPATTPYPLRIICSLSHREAFHQIASRPGYDGESSHLPVTPPGLTYQSIAKRGVMKGKLGGGAAQMNSLRSLWAS